MPPLAAPPAAALPAAVAAAEGGASGCGAGLAEPEAAEEEPLHIAEEPSIPPEPVQEAEEALEKEREILNIRKERYLKSRSKNERILFEKND